MSDNQTDDNNFEKSKWAARMAEILKNPQLLADFEAAVTKFLAAKSKSNPTIRRAEQAMNLFRSGKAGELLTPRNVLLLGAALLYLISPLDGIPDLVPIIGLLDDLGILSMVLAIVIPELLKNKDTQPEVKEDWRHEAEIIENEEVNDERPKNSADFGSWLGRFTQRMGFKK
ncbi:MAG: DUF1232 domain-containing protein [Akkermansia sp.]|nr:DUF1232 domain-containing protein [Akkermansia sp.]